MYLDACTMCKAAGLWPSIDLGAIQATGGIDLPDLVIFGG